jgi:hypothetical protein
MKILCLLCLMLALFACTNKAPELSEADINEIENTIEAHMSELMTAADNLKTTELQNYLMDGPNKNYYLSGVAYSKDELISATNTEYQNFMSQKLTLKDHSIKVIAPTSVLWIGEISADSTDLYGQTESMNFTDTWLWEKIADKWLVTHMHESWE